MHCPPPTREEIWVLLSLVLSPGLPALLTASVPPWEKWGWGRKAPQPATAVPTSKVGRAKG